MVGIDRDSPASRAMVSVSSIFVSLYCASLWFPVAFTIAGAALNTGFLLGAAWFVFLDERLQLPIISPALSGLLIFTEN